MYNVITKYRSDVPNDVGVDFKLFIPFHVASNDVSKITLYGKPKFISGRWKHRLPTIINYLHTLIEDHAID